MQPLLVLHDERFQRHRGVDGHPECPGRLAGLGSKEPFISIQSATLEDLALVHTPRLIETVARTAGKPLTFFDPDTYAGPESFEIARLAVGAMLEGVEAVLQQRAQSAFALVRPPGHHAESNRAMGFCLFNNIAVAAAAARRDYGLERVAILDWDVHHGNGTQEIFWKSPHVLYLSIHQFPFYPGTGDVHETGEGDGEGYTVNVPVPPGLGDADYAAVFGEIFTPVLQAYQPQLLLISAGFDAYKNDPLGGEALTPRGFAVLTAIVKQLSRELCDSRLVLGLEGGYDLQGLHDCVAATLGELQNRTSAASVVSNRLHPATASVIAQVKRSQAPYWKF